MSEEDKIYLQMLHNYVAPIEHMINNAMSGCFNQLLFFSSDAMKSGGNTFFTRSEGAIVNSTIAEMAKETGDYHDAVGRDMKEIMNEMNEIQKCALSVASSIQTRQHMDMPNVMTFIKLAPRMMNFLKILHEVEE